MNVRAVALFILGLTAIRTPFGADDVPVPATATVNTAAPSRDAVQILYTHDGMGELEPCGCRGNPLGGFTRRSAVTTALRKEIPRTFSVETGNSFFENTVTPDGLAPVLGFQSEEIAESFRKLPLHLFVPGEKDFSLGRKHLEKLHKKSGVKFLAANLVGTNGKVLFSATQVDSIGHGRSIRWIGLVGTDLTLPSDVLAKDPAAALRRELAKLPAAKRKKEVLFILSELGLEADRELARAFPEVRVIIGSRDQAFLQNPVEVGHTLIVQTSYRNQYLGRLVYEPETDSIRSELVALEEKWDANAPKAATDLIAHWKKGVADIEAKVRKVQDREAASAAKTTAATEAAEGVPPEPANPTFPSCIQCHGAIFDFWRKTAHATALTPLKEKNLLNHPSCLVCHTLSTEAPALLYADGRHGDWEAHEALMREIARAEKVDSPITPERTSPPKPMGEALAEVTHARGSVQCASCHVVSGNHPFTGTVTKSVPQTTCLKCHTRDRAPSWYDAQGLSATVFAEKRKKVQCPRDNP